MSHVPHGPLWWWLHWLCRCSLLFFHLHEHTTWPLRLWNHLWDNLVLYCIISYKQKKPTRLSPELFVRILHRCFSATEQTTTPSDSLLPDDDWQEEHKRLAELDERDGLGGGQGLGGPGMGAESDLGGAENSSSRHLPSSAVHLPLPSSLPSLKFSSSSSGLPPPGQWCN